MNKSLMPTIDSYVTYSVELNRIQNELVQLERQLLEAKKSLIFAYHKGDNAKLREVNDVIKGLTSKKLELTSSFETICKKEFYMYSTYTNASETLSISELNELIESIKAKMIKINNECRSIDERKMKLFSLANNSMDKNVSKRARELSIEYHTKLTALVSENNVYAEVKRDIEKVLKKKQEETTPQMR